MKIKVVNRSSGPVGYQLPEINLQRVFAAGEEKTIDRDEIQKLIYQPGGQELVDAYFLIKDADAAEEFSPLISKEPEYNYTEEDVIRLIKYGSLDEFLDALDFAPQGVVEMIKSLSISLPITDTMKIQAFKEKKGTDLGHLIELNKEDAEIQTQQNTGRRVRTEEVTESNNEAETPQIRRYNVINRK